ncbi:trypsin Blo t 3-like [Schistocerca serialis cubense]|uniref:trypsin Blo t 3-like n=1 Tax=Schistocerca serialis cubense TaxID=2023355 RepID=UPI00214E012F|nr:trypsin Blo t 3-like [Schistocerca serialis cubense]
MGFKVRVLLRELVSGSLLVSNAQAVGLASDNYDPPGGLGVTVTGWEATLLKVDILDRNTCRNTFANINTVTDRMVCAGQAGKSVCIGDWWSPGQRKQPGGHRRLGQFKVRGHPRCLL